MYIYIYIYIYICNSIGDSSKVNVLSGTSFGQVYDIIRLTYYYIAKVYDTLGKYSILCLSRKYTILLRKYTIVGQHYLSDTLLMPLKIVIVIVTVTVIVIVIILLLILLNTITEDIRTHLFSTALLV